MMAGRARLIISKLESSINLTLTRADAFTPDAVVMTKATRTRGGNIKNTRAPLMRGEEEGGGRGWGEEGGRVRF